MPKTRIQLCNQCQALLGDGDALAIVMKEHADSPTIDQQIKSKLGAMKKYNEIFYNHIGMHPNEMNTLLTHSIGKYARTGKAEDHLKWGIGFAISYYKETGGIISRYSRNFDKSIPGETLEDLKDVKDHAAQIVAELEQLKIFIDKAQNRER